MRLAVAAVLAAGLSACGDRASEPAPTPVEPIAPAASPVTPASGADTLNAEGFGPLRIGMSLAEVEAALGPDANPEAVGGPEPEVCDQFRPARAPEGLLVMIERGVLTSVRLTRSSTATADAGVSIGDSEAAVRAAYSSPDEQAHAYEAAPAKYLTAWSGAARATPDARGLRFEIGQDGRVSSITGGGPSIQYVEGCL
jgi:pyruvate/2-oxoglutarate dehydrogenase complex dihydrolipoamide acyltransferase (E2) component